MGDIDPLVWVIGACEVGFWVLLGLGLSARYLLRLRRVSAALLLCVPLLDLVLVGAAALDVAGGAEPRTVHGLAGLYLGFTVAFGHSTIRWADGWFAHRFAGGPRPAPKPRAGAARARYEWRVWGRVVVMTVVALAVLSLLSVAAGRGIPMPTEWASDPLWNWGLRAVVVTGIWFVAGPIWYSTKERTDA
ncbi:hypothetical protein [Pseudonocardia pini]|uniref:hypothetical protein n=1 Tax=Pseudonocardia pini TaxID=2758030 RepID=UPI0015EFDCBB|nr:hypothetical protein [Pseudonocardia pini]